MYRFGRWGGVRHFQRALGGARIDGDRDPTLSCIMRLLTDTPYRKGLVGKLENAMVKEFFVSRFDRWNDRYRDEAIEPVLNKVGQFLSSPIMCGIVEQPGAKLDLRDIMDDGKILIVNLSKGRVGEDK